MSSTERRPDDGQRCPDCGTSREPGSAPACGCTERAADAARDARSADAAAAEDFDPLRIRPYVTLPEPTEEPGPAPAAPLPPEAVAPLRAGDVGLFTPDKTPSLLPYDDEPAAGRGRIGLYAVLTAVAVVVAVAVLATLLLAPDKPQREQALPDVPTRAVEDSATTASPSGSPSSPRPQPPTSQAASPPPSRSATASATATASPKPRTPRPPSRSTARATGSVEPATPKADSVLSRGDTGPEVKELQQRLRQLYLYMGEPHGTYDTPVEEAVTRFQYARGTRDDGRGVYGRATRAALEAETRAP